MVRTIKWWFFLAFGFYICAVLSVFPVSESIQWFRPQWLLLFFIYCQIAYPKYFNPILAWVGGLLLDCLLENPLGEHASRIRISLLHNLIAEIAFPASAFMAASGKNISVSLFRSNFNSMVPCIGGSKSAYDALLDGIHHKLCCLACVCKITSRHQPFDKCRPLLLSWDIIILFKMRSFQETSCLKKF